MEDTKPSLIFKAIPRVIKQLGTVGKNQTNEQPGFKYKYRGIDDIYNAIGPLFVENGIFTVPEVLEATCEERVSSHGKALFQVRLKVRFTLFAEDGSSFTGSVYGEGMDSGDKATSKAHTAAHKAFLTQVFIFRTEDLTDADSESHEVEKTQARTFYGPQGPKRVPGITHAASHQIASLWSAWKVSGRTEEELRDVLQKKYQKSSTGQLTDEEVMQLMAMARTPRPTVKSLIAETITKLPKAPQKE